MPLTLTLTRPQAEAYSELRRPLLVNDLASQSMLMDRRKVYLLLISLGIPVPEHVVCNRDGAKPTWSAFEEHEDHIVVDGVRMDKPFVEKPVNGLLTCHPM